MKTTDINLQTSDQGDLSLRDAEGNTIRIDFNLDYDYRRKLAGPKSELLSKALGAHRLGSQVIDLTAGLAVDSMSMVRLGYSVFAIERQEKVFKLLQHAFTRWDSPDKVRLHFHRGECLEVIRGIAERQLSPIKDILNYQIGYFDPMFPRKKKSALPKQEVVVLQKITNEDPDSQSIFESLRALNFFKRMVVKRPIDALAFAKPTAILKGKLIRYDIYDDHHRAY